MRFILILALALVLRPAFCQEAPGAATPSTAQFNFLSQMLREQPPVLQPGYRSERDKWLLYSPQFRVLSAATQTFLLRKYGYSSELSGTFSASGAASTVRPTGSRPQPSRRAAHQNAARILENKLSTKLAAGENTRVTFSDAEAGRRVENEACIAVSGQDIVVTYNDSGDGDRVSYSQDGGATWHESQVAFFPGLDFNVGDPVVAAGPNGRFYHSDLAPNSFGDLIIGVSHSDDGGATWSPPSNPTASINLSENSFDKDWMAVDNISGSPYFGNVYASWTMITFNRSGPDTPGIQLARSTDGGSTWSSAVALTQVSQDDALAGHEVQDSFITIGPQGEVYVAWFDTRVSGVRISKSVDGGVTFSNPVTALVRPSLGTQDSVTSTGNFEVSFFHSVAVDTSSGPNRGTVYLAAQVLGASGNLDVSATTSRDGGVTWSDPVRVTSDTTATDRFQPDVAVADNGNVGIIFYDRRNDPDNNSLMDLYVAISTDAGRSFPINSRVTTTNWPVLPTPLGYRPGYHGDYNKVTAVGNDFYAAWGDDRSGLNPDVYVATIPATASTPDFVMASSQASADVLPGGSATYSIATGGLTGLEFSAGSSYPGVSFSFSNNTLSASSTPGTTPGTYTIQVQGVNRDGLTRRTDVRLTVHSPQLTQVPVSVTPLRSPAYIAQAAADQAGNIYLVTVEETLSSVRKRIVYRFIPAGTTQPGPPQTVFRADPGNADQAVSDAWIAVNSTGQIYIVWRLMDTSSSVIMISSSSDGLTFSAPLEISQTAGPLSFAYRPSLAVGTDGSVYVSFVKETLRESLPKLFLTVAQDLYLTSSTDGGATFSAPVNVSRYNSASRTVLTASYPSLVLDGDNQPNMVWRSSENDIFYARSTDGGQTFSPVVNVSNTSSSVSPSEPSLAMDAQNHIFVAWTNLNNDLDQQDIFIAVSADGVQFQTLGNVSYGTLWSGSLADWPALGVDASGTLTAVWRELVANPTKADDPERDMFYARSSDGGVSWSPPVNFTTNLGDTVLGGGVSTTAMPPALAIDPSGRVTVFWDDDTAGGTQIWMLPLP